MIDDVYQLATAAVRRHLTQAGSAFREEDGDFVIGDHRLGLSVVFEGFSRQAEQAIAPLDVQIHVDGDDGSRFRMGALGVGETQETALSNAVDEWHLLAASPLLAALGAEAGKPRRTNTPGVIAGWRLFSGRVGLRGTVPSALHAGGGFFTQLLTAIREEASRWPSPQSFTLRSMIVVAGCQEGQQEVQAAVDGFVSERFTELLNALPWPSTAEAYFYKQLFVLRHDEAAR